MSKSVPPFGIFDPEKMTDVQKTFWVGMTDQRVANLWDASDFIAELKPEAKDLLRNADKETLRWLERARPEEIEQLQRSIKFMEASKLFAKIFWFLVASGAITFFALTDKFSALFAKAKIP
jgi:hypothetical protein